MNLASQVRYSISPESSGEEETMISTGSTSLSHLHDDATTICESNRDHRALNTIMPSFLSSSIQYQQNKMTMAHSNVIVLYNYGLSHNVLAAVNAAPQQPHEEGEPAATSIRVSNSLIQTSMRMSAARILELSERLLSKIITECIFQPSSTILLGMLLMRSLIRVFVDLDRPASKYRTTLSRLVAMVQLQHRLFPAADEQCVAPAT